MAKIRFSSKQLMINRANTQIVAMIAGATVLVIFSLVASRALLSQRGYQGRVIAEKEKAVRQLRANVGAVGNLVTAYNQFQSAPENVLDGNPKGTGERDGDNARIVLDALPSQYDFPALATSLEKLLTSPNYTIGSITGTDDELNQQGDNDDPDPKPIDMPFEIAVSGTYGAIQNLVGTLDRSIRPFQLETIELAGTDSKMDVTITAKTFYQPEKSLELRTKDIK